MSKSILIRAVLVFALLVLLVVLLTDDDAGGIAVDEPRLVSLEQLSEFAADQDHPVYWLGERGGSEYELEERSSGEVYVRYLDPGTEAGDDPGKYLTVVTYPVDDGVAALERSVRSQEDLRLGQTSDGAVLLIDAGSPRNAHLAYPGDQVHVEIFDPVAGKALRSAARGEAQQVP
jgi:hypothetical protein